MRDQRSGTRETDLGETTIAGWFWMGVVTLVVLPFAGLIAAALMLDATRSFEAHVATAAVLPAVLITLVARRMRVPSWLVLRLALIAALSAMVLLDLGWSG